MSINTIEAGKSLNVIPDRCTLGIDIRTLPGQAHQAIIDRLEAMLVKLDERHAEFEASISIIRSVGGIETDTEHEFVRAFCAAVDIKETRAVGYTTDAPFLTPLGAPILIFGPGEGSMCPQPDESIAIRPGEGPEAPRGAVPRRRPWSEALIGGGPSIPLPSTRKQRSRHSRPVALKSSRSSRG